MSALKLYGYQTTRSLKVAWTLEELGLDYDYVECHPTKVPEGFRNLNPYLKVPVLEDQGRFVFETSAICTYLCDRERASRFLPAPGTYERARHDQWLSVIQTELEPALWMRVKHKFVLPEELRVRDPRLKLSLAYEVKDTLAPIIHELKHSPWLTGPAFSQADVFLSYCLQWASYYHLWSDPVLANFLQAAQSRKTYQRAMSKTKAQSPD